MIFFGFNVLTYLWDIPWCTQIVVFLYCDDVAKNVSNFDQVLFYFLVIDRHQGRVIFLEYEPTSSSPTSSLFLVGKGVTYDTGGADIKISGNMAGMARDKCGAAVVAGFMKVNRVPLNT